MHFRGEGTEGYSEALRELEFTSVFLAEMKDYITISSRNNNHETSSSTSSTLDPKQIDQYLEGIQFQFQDALTYYGPIYYEPSMKDNYENDDRIRLDASNADSEGEPIPLAQAAAYESAMQFVAISLPKEFVSDNSGIFSSLVDSSILQEVLQTTVQRCSLIRTTFQIVAEGQTYEELATKALVDEAFTDMMEGGINEDATWSIRLRRYGPMELVDSASEDNDVADDGTQKPKRLKQARYGKNVRSPLRDERKAIFSMAELVQLFRGKVDLTNPECRIYLLEGLQHCGLVKSTCYHSDHGEDRKLLARVIAKGPKVCACPNSC